MLFSGFITVSQWLLLGFNALGEVVPADVTQSPLGKSFS